MRSAFRQLVGTTTAALMLAAPVAGLGSLAGARPAAATTEGPCAAGEGVTVVVDATALGGGRQVRCAPGERTSGLDALSAAGFAYGFVPGQPGLVCTIGGRPDPCNGAPADAYWGYWHAPAGGSWTYSTRGAGNRRPEPGSVEGWVFGAGQAPGLAPPAAAAAPTSTTAPPTTAPPSTAAPQTTASASTAPPTTTAPTTTAPTSTAPPTTTAPTTTAPASTAPPTSTASAGAAPATTAPPSAAPSTTTPASTVAATSTSGPSTTAARAAALVSTGPEPGTAELAAAESPSTSGDGGTSALMGLAAIAVLGTAGVLIGRRRGRPA